MISKIKIIQFFISLPVPASGCSGKPAPQSIFPSGHTESSKHSGEADTAAALSGGTVTLRARKSYSVFIL